MIPGLPGSVNEAVRTASLRHYLCTNETDSVGYVLLVTNGYGMMNRIYFLVSSPASTHLTRHSQEEQSTYASLGFRNSCYCRRAFANLSARAHTPSTGRSRDYILSGTRRTPGNQLGADPQGSLTLRRVR